MRPRKAGVPRATKGRMVLIYAHKDRDFVEKSTFTDFLEDVAREIDFEFWWDKRMTQGSWEDEIRFQLENAKIVVCLVSQSFLMSTFITDVEAKIVSRRSRKEGLIVIPVIYQDCRWQSRPWLAKLDVFPKDGGRPFLHGRNDQAQIFKQVTDHILERVKGRGATYREPRSLYTLRRLPDTAFTPEEAARLREDSRTRADWFVPSRELQEQICQKAKAWGASVETSLSKEMLAKLDKLFLALREGRQPDPKKIRWVLRAAGLHPQGRAPKVLAAA